MRKNSADVRSLEEAKGKPMIYYNILSQVGVVNFGEARRSVLKEEASNKQRKVNSCG